MTEDTSKDFGYQRSQMVERYLRMGYIKAAWMEKAMRETPRELFMSDNLKRYSYADEPFPIPGDGRQTISAPYTYPLFYEPLELSKGDKLLEVGMGSGYGAALAYEVIGETGVVVSIEFNKVTFEFGRKNLLEGGYEKVIMIHGDGSKGYPSLAPYDKICITAACPDIPKPLLEQLRTGGSLVAPVGPADRWLGQDLIIIHKEENGQITTKNLSKVVYVPLQGEYGWNNNQR